MLSLVGIRPEPGSIGPAGIHLRWAFTVELGFPVGPFRLYRRNSQSKPIVTAMLDRIPPDTPLPDGAVLDGIHFAFPAGGGLYGTDAGDLQPSLRSPSLRVELRFTEPVARVLLSLQNPGAVVVRAFGGARLVLQRPIADTDGVISVDLKWPGITHIELPLDFGRLRQLSYSTVKQVCRGEDLSWQHPRATLAPVVHESEVAQRFEPGLHNRYVTSPPNAVTRYGGREASALVDWLAGLRFPVSPPFVDADVPPHRLELEGDPQSPVSRLRPLPMLLAASLDPNIARLLGLYWVDRDDSAGGPQPGRAYDYKVEAGWNGQVQCGLALEVGMQAAERPQVRGPVIARQGRGFDWEGRVPRARVAIRWGRPSAMVGVTPTQAVLYDVARIDGVSRQPLTAEAPVMVPAASFGQADGWIFREPNVPLGHVRYSVSAIDLFGQTGPGLESGDVELVDLEPPPPPVRIRAELVPGGRAVTIEFEYGYVQRRRAPDARLLRCHARRDSRVETRLVAVEAVGVVADGERRWRHLLRLSDSLGAPLSADALRQGDLLRYQVLRVTHDADGRRRSLQGRQRLVIDAVRADGLVEVVSTESLVHEGRGELVSDPKAPHLWHRLPPEVKLRQPVSATYEGLASSLTARIVAVHDHTESVSRLAQLPLDRQPPDLQVPAMRELLLDVALIDADIFRDGTAEIGGRIDTVFYQTAGGLAGQGPASIIVPTTMPAVSGQTVSLRPSSSLSRRYIVVDLRGEWPAGLPHDRGGEIAFPIEDSGSQVRARLGRILSGVTARTGRLSMLVEASETLSDELVAGMECELSSTYQTTVQLDSINLTPEPGKASCSLVLAITAEDDRGNESSLSLPALVVAMRPAPQGVPSVPHVCGGTSADAEGYASRPDARGDATLCITWNTGNLKPHEGLNWEVGRALDATILAVHQREWSSGRLDASPPVAQGLIIFGELSQITDAGNGLFVARWAPTGSAPDIAQVKGARLQQASRCWTITSAAAASAAVAQALDVMLRPTMLGDPAPTAGTVSFETRPDYTAVLGNGAALRALAATLPDAFAIVTGAALPTMEYRDVLPGTGRNSFFYRVRAVDAAQQRSEWSPVSAPMRLVDTTPPAIPIVTRTVGGERRATLSWSHNPDAGVEQYLVHRARNQADLAAPFGLPVIADIRVRSGVEVTWVDEPLEGTLRDERYFYRVTAVKRVRHGIAPDDVYKITSLPSQTIGVTVLDTSIPAPVDWLSAAWVQPAQGSPFVRLQWDSSEAVFTIERNNRQITTWERIDVPVNPSAGSFLALDYTANPTLVYGYRVRAWNRYGRQSEHRSEISVSPLQ
ncbi:hypothetical protein [Kocuria sp. LHG3120]|uniref:hypothetical protein n=1 Tax=Kocuria sp. LHG3120 TaxID=2804590 RepID=UPI003CFAEAAD